jgi:hypothetical protein
MARYFRNIEPMQNGDDIIDELCLWILDEESGKLTLEDDDQHVVTDYDPDQFLEVKPIV